MTKKGETKMKMDNKLYDTLKFIGTLVLPALATFYATLGNIWGLPFTTEIPATIMAIDTLLNACLGLSSASYYKELNVDKY